MLPYSHYEVLMCRIIRAFSKGLELSLELKDKLEVLRNPSTSSQKQLQAISADLQMDVEFSSLKGHLKVLRNLTALWQGLA